MSHLDLQLIKGPFINHCNFNVKDNDYKHTKSVSIETLYSYNIEIDSEKKIVTTRLAIQSETETIPFSFDVKAAAQFHYNKLPKKEDDIQKKIFIETIPYIFSFIKELVADMTRKAYFSPFYIPYLDMKKEKFDKVIK